jgi:hypothetical protein
VSGPSIWTVSRCFCNIELRQDPLSSLRWYYAAVSGIGECPQVYGGQTSRTTPHAAGESTHAAAATHGPPTSRPAAHDEMTTIARITHFSRPGGSFLGGSLIPGEVPIASGSVSA